MKTIEIKATERKTLGKKATKKLRKELQVPCVMYGQKSENVHFHAHKNDFRHIIYTPKSYIVNLNIDGNKSQALMQSVDFHPVTDEILHIDFFKIDPSKKFKIEIPIVTEGSPVGVRNEGGVMSVSRRKVLVKALIGDLPDELTVDVTNLKIGDAIRISDLNEVNEKLEFLDPQSVVVSVNVTRLAKSMELDEEGEGEEGEEGEEGAAEGAEATEKTDEKKAE